MSECIAAVLRSSRRPIWENRIFFTLSSPCSIVTISWSKLKKLILSILSKMSRNRRRRKPTMEFITEFNYSTATVSHSFILWVIIYNVCLLQEFELSKICTSDWSIPQLDRRLSTKDKIKILKCNESCSRMKSCAHGAATRKAAGIETKLHQIQLFSTGNTLIDFTFYLRSI